MLPVTDAYTCPTCTHTLAKLCSVGDATYSMCERCGTLRVRIAGATEAVVYVPKLVERCRKYAASVLSSNIMPSEIRTSEWVRLGIAESINVPTDRLQHEQPREGQT